MPLIQPVGGFSVEAELIDNITRKLDSIDRGIDDITARRIAADKAAAAASKNAASTASMGWTEFRSIYSTVLDIARVGQQVWDETGQKFVDYAGQVREVSRAFGTVPEEASRLIQVSDDLGVSYNSLTTSLKMAQKDGIDPSIEGLAKLADEYLALEPGVKRTQFLLDNFGKSGLEMGKLMEKGGDGIRELSADIDDSMILTQEALDQAREYEIAVDSLSDSWDAFTYQVAPKVVNALTSVINDMRDWNVANELAKEDGETLFFLSGEKYQAYIDEAAAIREQTDAALLAAEGNQEFAGALSENEEAIELAEKALQEYKDMLEEVSQANQDAEKFMQSYADFSKGYAENHADAVEKIREAEEKLSEARSEFGAGSDQAMRAQESLDEARQGIQELEASWHESTQKMIYDMVMAKVSVDGLTDAEFRATQQLAVQMGIRTQAQADEAIAMMEKATAIADGIALQEDVVNEKADADAKLLELEAAKEAAAAETTQTIVDGNNAAVQSEQALTASIDAASVALGRQADAARKAAEAMMYANAAAPNTGTTATNKGGSGGGGGKKHEFGGEFIVPPQYGREGFALGDYGTASAGEKITITPPGKSTGGVYNIVINNPKREAAEDTLRAFFSKMRYLGVAV